MNKVVASIVTVVSLVAIAIYAVPALALTTDKVVDSLNDAQVTVSSTAQKISSSHYMSAECWNMTSTPMYLGPSDVTTANGRPICTDTAVCPTSSWSGDISAGAGLSVIGTSGTLKCIIGE